MVVSYIMKGFLTQCRVNHCYIQCDTVYSAGHCNVVLFLEARFLRGSVVCDTIQLTVLNRGNTVQKSYFMSYGTFLLEILLAAVEDSTVQCFYLM